MIIINDYMIIINDYMIIINDYMIIINDSMIIINDYMIISNDYCEFMFSKSLALEYENSVGVFCRQEILTRRIHF